ncbi:MAG: hypothetical protein AAGE01_17580 [Pseudomonadota bacterium]
MTIDDQLRRLPAPRPAPGFEVRVRRRLEAAGSDRSRLRLPAYAGAMVAVILALGVLLMPERPAERTEVGAFSEEFLAITTPRQTACHAACPAVGESLDF